MRGNDEHRAGEAEWVAPRERKRKTRGVWASRKGAHPHEREKHRERMRNGKEGKPRDDRGLCVCVCVCVCGIAPALSQLKE